MFTLWLVGLIWKTSTENRVYHNGILHLTRGEFSSIILKYKWLWDGKDNCIIGSLDIQVLGKKGLIRKKGLISVECDELIWLLNSFYLFLYDYIEWSVVRNQTLKGIGKHLEEISRLLHINNGKLFIAATAFKIMSQNIVPLWPLTVS